MSKRNQLPTDPPSEDAREPLSDEDRPTGLAEDAGLEDDDEVRFLAAARFSLRKRNPELYRMTDRIAQRLKKG